jgi:hypothetical protein
MVVKVLLKYQMFKPTFEHKLDLEAFDQTGDWKKGAPQFCD